MPHEAYNHDTDQRNTDQRNTDQRNTDQRNTDQRNTDQRTRCEFDKTLVGAPCEVPGEVLYAGVCVCLHHALLLALEERVDTLMSVVFSLDRLAEAPDLREDELRLPRLKHQIRDAEDQLRFSYLELDLARMQM